MLTVLPPGGLPIFGSLLGLIVGLVIGTALLVRVALRGRPVGQAVRSALLAPALAAVAGDGANGATNRATWREVFSGVTPWGCEPVKPVGTGHFRGRVATAGLPWRLGCARCSDPRHRFASSLAGLARPSTRTDHV